MTAGWGSALVLLVLTAIPVAPLVLWTAAVAAARSLRGLPTGGRRFGETVLIGVRLHLLVLTVPAVAGLVIAAVFGTAVVVAAPHLSSRAMMSVTAVWFAVPCVGISATSWASAYDEWRRLTRPIPSRHLGPAHDVRDG